MKGSLQEEQVCVSDSTGHTSLPEAVAACFLVKAHSSIQDIFHAVQYFTLQFSQRDKQIKKENERGKNEQDQI